jgi:CBS domain-containing protein
MHVKQMLPRARERLATIGANAPVVEAAALMSEPHTDLVVVCDDEGSMVGVITKTDIVKRIRQCTGAGCRDSVETIMEREVVSCRPDDVLRDVWQILSARGLQRIPVLDEYCIPVGIIYARDALQRLLGESEDEDALLRDYIGNTGYR